MAFFFMMGLTEIGIVISDLLPYILGFILFVFGVGLTVYCVMKELKHAEDEDSDGA